MRCFSDYTHGIVFMPFKNKPSTEHSQAITELPNTFKAHIPFMTVDSRAPVTTRVQPV